MGNRPFSRKICNFFCKLTAFWGVDELPAASSPSQALPRQLPQRGSQAVKFIAKVLGAMRKLPAVLLALPLGELSPKVTERASPLPGNTPSGSLRSPAPPRGRLCVAPETLPPPPKAVPLGKVASPQAMTEGVSCRQVLTEGVRPRPKTPSICKKSYNFFLKKAGFPLTALL